MKTNNKNHDNTIRIRGVETSKTMLPCWRGALLAKSACFKKVPDDILFENHLLKTIGNASQQRKYRNDLQKAIENTTNLAISGSHCGSSCNTISYGETFVWQAVFRKFWGTPLNRCWPPAGAHLVRCS